MKRLIFALVLLLLSSLISSQTDIVLKIYTGETGQLLSGFENWSWATVDFQDTTYVREGSKYSLSVVMTNYQALYLHGDFIFPIEDLDILSFWINGGKEGGESINIRIISGVTPVGAAVPIDKILGGPIPKEQWVQVKVPFSDFGVQDKSTSISGVWFESTSGSYDGTVYFDEILVEEIIQPPTPVSVVVATAENRHEFSRNIFGVNFATKDQINANKYTLNRWGGNAVTRYAWDIDVSNHASDWFFENIPNPVNESMLPFNTSSDRFIKDTLSTDAKVLLTLPTIGWTPFDRKLRCGFSVSKYGAQTKTDPDHSDCGNGIGTDGKYIKGNDPRDTSRAITPAYDINWINHIDTAFGANAVRWFQLDNEPGLWGSTHRDVHPQELTYDELWNFTLLYASSIKKAFPNSLIFGPVNWGWCSYMFSPEDGCSSGPDRKAHGDIPLLQWYIQQISRYKFETGIQLVDVIDVHFYPSAYGVAFGIAEDLFTSTIRLRSPKSLYDPSYVDEGWVSAVINLIPMVKGWIDEFTPGLKFSISEYNFGADTIITGTLANTEALAIFAREELDFAARWVAPASGSMAEDAFKVFLNYNDKGAQITGYSVLANSSNVDEVGAYAFDDDKTKTLFVLLISKIPNGSVTVTVDLTKSNISQGQIHFYSYTKTDRLGPSGSGSVAEGKFVVNMPSWSATLAVVSY
eukprot:TRINITY_DN679_c0_g1_i1.p1 TRINITY_DN679_c0_g1~~TRINITY_DN679_c0_g1_i1.p1  ORF type:complete len:692 (+),score=152.56 TRINITY_DN679_c0_g1_i1:68-2143(+)